MKAFVVSLPFFVMCFILVGCSAYIASYEKPGPNPAANYRFDYAPKPGKTLKKELTFLLINPEYQTKTPSYYDVPVTIGSTFQGATPDLSASLKRVVDDYTSAMGTDFKEMMTTRGFRLVQMLRNQDMATFGQREQSNFALRAKVTIELGEQPSTSENPSQNVLTGEWSVAKSAGQYLVKSRIDLEAYEPLTWQLFWVKSVETDQQKTEYSYKWNYAGRGGGFVLGEDTRPQALASLLELSYNDTMDKLFVYLDPEEFTMLNGKAQEIRQKSAGSIR